LPVQRTFAPEPSVTSAQERPVSSETRRPVWIASSSSVWSRRPIQVVASGAASSALISVSVRNATIGLS